MTVIGSLCTGTGGLDHAAQAVLGGDLAWVCDPDPGAVVLLAHRYPHIPNHGDLIVTDWATVEPVDVLTAGWPCQPFSVAGRRKGAADERAIWPHIARAVRDLRPRHVLLENVAAVVGSGELARAAGDLAALGYMGAWGCLRASDAGAPHRRERLFIVATADPRGGQLQRRRDGRVLAGAEGPEPRPRDQRERDRDPALDRGPAAPDPDQFGVDRAGPAREPARRRGLRPGPPDGRGEPAPDPASAGRGPRSRVREPAGPPPRGNRPRAAAPDPDRRGLPEHPERDRGPQPRDDRAQRHDALRRRVLRDAPDLDWGEYTPAIQHWEHILGRPAPAPTVLGARGGQVLNPGFVEWLMGLPPGWVTAVPGLSRIQQLRLLGNGVVPQQAALAFRRLLAASPLAAA